MARYGGDEWLHRGRSGKVVVALGVGEGQELPGFLVGLENVSGEVAGGLDRPGVSAANGRGLTHLPSCLRWMCSPGPPQVEFTAGLQHKHARHRRVRRDPGLRLVKARRVAFAGTYRPEAGRRRGVRIRLAIEGHLFSGAFEPQLYLQQDHMTVIRPSAWP